MDQSFICFNYKEVPMGSIYIFDGNEYTEDHPKVIEWKKEQEQKVLKEKTSILQRNAFNESDININEYGIYGIFSAPTNEGYHDSAPIRLLGVFEGKPKDIKDKLVEYPDFIYLWRTADGYYVGEIRKLEVRKV